MDFKVVFYCLVSFLLGRLSKIKVYVGSDLEKYERADYGIYLAPK